MTLSNGGYVYFIRKWGQDIFKIGMTLKTPEARLEQIQVNTPDQLYVYGAIFVLNPRELEAELHKKFNKQRLQGEWFNLSEDTIRKVLEDHPGAIDPDWIELKQGRKVFWYQISTNELYIDFRSLNGFSQTYLASLFVLGDDQLKMFKDNSLAVNYDILINDWPKMANELKEHKETLLKAAKRFMAQDQASNQ